MVVSPFMPSISTQERTIRRLQRQLEKARQQATAFETMYEDERLHVALLRQLALVLLPMEKRTPEGIRDALIEHCAPLPRGYDYLANGYLTINPGEPDVLLDSPPIKLELVDAPPKDRQ